jgi:GTPase SAR1 family protein
MSKSGIKDRYEERKASVISFLENTISFCEKHGDDKFVDILKEKKLETENHKFSIVVVGEFSAGKSTFLNALMGEKYLPSFSNETTASVNFLDSIKESPNQKESFVVDYADGTVSDPMEVKESLINKFVSTKGDDVVTKVKSVHLFFDSKFLNDGVSLVDTPGLNGVADGHREITERQIECSHASIFMFKATQPGSESDFVILKKLKDKCNSIIIVLNQIDLIKESEQSVDDVIQTLEANYHKVFPNDSMPEIIPIAAYPALVARSSQNMEFQGKLGGFTDAEKQSFLEKSRIEVFEERLMKYLTQGEKAKQELLSPVQSVMAFLQHRVADLNKTNELLNSKTDAADIQKQIDVLKGEVEKRKEELNDSKSSISREVNQLLRNAKEGIYSETAHLKDNYMDKLSQPSDLDELESDAKRYIRKINNDFASTYRDAVSELNQKLDDFVIEQYGKYKDEIEKEVEQTINKASDINLVNFDLDSSYFDLDIDLDSFNAKQADLKNIKRTLENDIDKSSELIRNGETAQKKAERLEAQKEESEKYTDAQIRLMGGRPGADQRVERTEKKSGGIWGWIKVIVNGNPPKYEEHTVYDYSRQKSYDDDRKRIMELSESKSAELQRKIDELNSDSDTSEYEEKKASLVRQLAEIEDEIRNQKEENQKSIEKFQKKRIRDARGYVEEIIDKINGDAKKNIESQLSTLVKDLTECIVKVVGDTLNQVIDEKNSSLQHLCEELSSSEQDKQNKINENEEIIKEAIVLIDNNECLLDELKNLNVIKKED